MVKHAPSFSKVLTWVYRVCVLFMILMRFDVGFP